MLCEQHRLPHDCWKIIFGMYIGSFYPQRTCLLSQGFAHPASPLCIVAFVWCFHEYGFQCKGQLSTSCSSKEQPSFLLSERLKACILEVAIAKLVYDWLRPSIKFGMYRFGRNKVERWEWWWSHIVAKRNAPDVFVKSRWNAGRWFVAKLTHALPLGTDRSRPRPTRQNAPDTSFKIWGNAGQLWNDKVVKNK